MNPPTAIASNSSMGIPAAGRFPFGDAGTGGRVALVKDVRGVRALVGVVSLELEKVGRAGEVVVEIGRASCRERVS